MYVLASDYYTQLIHYDVPKWFTVQSYLTYFWHKMTLRKFPRGISIVDSSYNNENPIFMMHSEKVYLLFHTNVPDIPVQLGTGFRAYAYHTGRYKLPLHSL